MSEMVERVKAAIAEKFAPAIDFRAPYAKVMLDVAARAAIAAMRAPTEAMLDLQIVRDTRDSAGWSIEPVWKAMIDDALKEG